MRRALAATVLAALVLTGCGESDEPTATEETPASETSAASEPASEDAGEPTEEPSEASPEAIEIEIEGDRVEPNGKRVKVTAGQPITLEIESDRAAELHVHSSPEQVLEVKKGESTLELTIDRPGIVDVEEHDTGLVILQLEVR